MKVVLLAGGYGTRISEESHLKPKPMIEIGDMPILWHIMKIYSYYGFNDFVICLGYKGTYIKNYFANYFLYNSDVTFDFTSEQKVIFHEKKAEPWKVTLVDTGLETMTGGRLKRVQKYIGNEDFMMTYGDGVGNINIKTLVDFHNKNKKIMTVTAVQPSGRFGALALNNNSEVVSFQEKPKGDQSWINAGFFVLTNKVFEFLENDTTIFERSPMEKVANLNQMQAYKHEGFWQPMDTLRDKTHLESLWKNNEAPWAIWKK